MNKQTTHKILIGILLILAGLVLAQFIRDAYIYVERQANHERVEKLINKDLALKWDTIDVELEEINKLISEQAFFNADLGRLYERAALIYMEKGETMTYYRHLGYALYYLERSDEKDHTINIYLDIANFFLNNYTDNSARKVIEEAQKIKAFDDIEDLQIKSYAFRVLAMLAIQDNDYQAAEEYLNKSQEIVAMSHTGVYEEAYVAINDIWLAKVYVETERYAECREKLEKWADSDMMTSDVYRIIFLRDMVIPFYHVDALLRAAEIFNSSVNFSQKDIEDKEERVVDALQDFITVCNENGYEKAELKTILELQQKYPPTSSKVRYNINSIVNSLYAELFENQNIAYVNAIDNMIDESKFEMSKTERVRLQTYRRTRIIIVSIVFVIVIILVLSVIILNSRYDGLTGLLNRKAFNHRLQYLIRRKQLYSVIMIDVDDFKKINDTYGHQNGDIVLERLGQLMQRETTPEVQCYRYGGEEFAVLLDRRAVPYVGNVAERLRNNMSQQAWEFADKQVITLSLGVATGEGQDDVLNRADENLYTSKTTGKNKITGN